jgi:hypothetical protein
MKTLDKLPTYIAFVLLAGFVSCDEKRADAPIAYDVDMEKYNHLAVSEDKVSSSHQNTLYTINQDLSYIGSKSGTVSFGNGSPMESGITLKERISRNIMIINALVDANKRQIADLSMEVKKYKKGNSEMYQALNENKKRIKDYERQLESLREELMVKDFTEDELNMIIDDLILESELLRVQSDKYRKDLSTGYYVCQDRKELKKQGLLVEKGGVLGIGQTTMLNAEAANENNFTPINIHEVRDIAIHGEKPELVTNHPEGTYEFQRKNNMVTYLHIENPEKFWKSSKYMVVAVR